MTNKILRKNINEFIKDAFKDYFKPITYLISYITSPCILWQNKEDNTFWTIAKPEEFQKYKGNIFSICIYQRVIKNWYGKWIEEKEFITLKGKDRIKESKKLFKIIRDRCS